MSASEESTGFLTLEEVIKEQEKTPLLLSDDAENMLEELRKIRNEDQGQNNPVAIDLRLGAEAYLSSKESPIKLSANNDYLTIQPGEFALLTTFEQLRLPGKIFGLISMKFTFKLKGLLNVSGFHIDPGYNGRFIMSVYNAGPNKIILKYKEKVFTVIFSKLNKESRRKASSTFQNVDGLKPDMISGLVGTPISPQNLHERIQKLELWNQIFIAVITGLVVAVLATIFGGK